MTFSYWSLARKEVNENAFLAPKETALAVLHSKKCDYICSLTLLVRKVIISYAVSGRAFVYALVFTKSNNKVVAISYTSLFNKIRIFFFTVIYSNKVETSNFTTVTILLLSSTHCSHIHHPIAVISTTTILFSSSAHADDSRHKHWEQCACIKNSTVLTLSHAGVCIFGMRCCYCYDMSQGGTHRCLAWPCFYILSWSSGSDENRGCHPCLSLSALFWLLRVVATSCFSYELRTEINNLSKKRPWPSSHSFPLLVTYAVKYIYLFLTPFLIYSFYCNSYRVIINSYTVELENMILHILLYTIVVVQWTLLFTRISIWDVCDVCGFRMAYQINTYTCIYQIKQFNMEKIHNWHKPMWNEEKSSCVVNTASTPSSQGYHSVNIDCPVLYPALLLHTYSTLSVHTKQSFNNCKPFLVWFHSRFLPQDDFH